MNNTKDSTNFIRVKHFSLFTKRVMIFDKDDIITSLLTSKHINYKINDAYQSDTLPYYVLFCDIPLIQFGNFKKIIEYAPIEMSLRGITDYKDFCESFIANLETHRKVKNS